MQLVIRRYISLAKLFIPTVFFLYSCVTSNVPSYTSPVVEFDIPDVMEQKIEPTLLSKHAHSCSYISLETTKESAIKLIKQVYTTDREIIVVDINGCLLFDKLSGKFIKKIGTTGKGPNEYMWIASSAFDEENKIIYILSIGNYAIIGYNLAGKAVYYSGRYARGLNRLGLIDSITYVSTVDNGKGAAKNRLLIGSFRDDSIRFTPNYSFFTFHRKIPNVTTTAHYNIDVCLYRFNQSLYMKEAWNDTIFEIGKPNVLIPKYVFRLNNLKIPEHLRGQPDQIASLLHSHCIYQVNPLETEDFLFFGFSQGKNFYACIYDKQKKMLSVIDKKSWLHLSYGMRNDLNGSVPFWPKNINQKGEMINWFQADRFCEWQKRHGEEILPDLTEEDNPVIMIVR